MDKPEALRLADALIERHGVESFEGDAAAELRRLSSENDLLGSAADKLRVAWRDEVHRLYAEKASLAAALASSCDEQRHQLWESGGVAGCERARVAERQRDALLEALKLIVEFVDAPTEGKRPDVFVMRISKARAAIKNAEGGQ